jgi:peptidoglycan/LPS O-acetylase OafA/YrhL
MLRTRIVEIDGIRGWAALSVMMSHLIFGVFVNVTPSSMAYVLREFFELILGGTLDVALFFVVSGDALATSHWYQRHRENFTTKLVKRYCRLAIPIFCSCVLVWLLTKANLMFNRPASYILHTEDWLGRFLEKDFAIRDVLLYAGVTVFVTDEPRLALNPFLGTMRIEFLGSLIVFCYLVIEARSRYKATILVLLTGLFAGYDSFLACFPFGVLCSYLRSKGAFETIRQSHVAQGITAIVAFSSLAAGTYCNRIWPGWFLPSIAAACIMTFSVYGNRVLIHFLSIRLSRWLGRISFPLYLTHFPVIASFTSGLVVVAWTAGCFTPIAIWLIVIASATLSLLAAWVFLPVELLARRISGLVARMAFRVAERLSEIPFLPTRASYLNAIHDLRDGI